jgi:hypothetical protein
MTSLPIRMATLVRGVRACRKISTIASLEGGGTGTAACGRGAYPVFLSSDV